MTRFIGIVVFISLLAGLGACSFSMSSEVDGSQLNAEPLLVVHSFISPQDSLLKVWVANSRPKAGYYDALTPNEVVVTLSDGEREAVLTYMVDTVTWSSEERFYAISSEEFPIESGKTYWLDVEAKDGRKVTGECTIPQPAPELNVEFFQYTSGEYYSDRLFSYGATLSWEDPERETNFYRIVQQSHTIYEDTTWISNMREVNSYDRIPFYDDTYGQGATYKVENPAYSLRSPKSDYFPETVELILEFYLISSDENYYEHHKRLYGTGNVDGNLFDLFREPAVIPSNLEGGLGIFAGYNSRIQRFRIEKAERM